MPSTYNLRRNARLLLHAGLQHLSEDSALLAVQASRRLPLKYRMPLGRVLRLLGGIGSGAGAIGALGSVMTGDRNRAVDLVASRSRGGRLRDEIAVMLDRDDLLSPRASAWVRSRAAWTRGEYGEALALLERAGRGESLRARRLRSEIALLEPSYRVERSVRDFAPLTRQHGERLRVLHIITNSLPHTQSGYSLRTHRILTALRDAGVDSVALTRTGYPVMVGLPFAADEDIIDGVRYVRTLPNRLPATQEERVQVEVDRALSLVEQFRPHVIHATTNYLNALVAQSVSEASGLPWVFEVRGLMEQTWIASRSTPEARAAASSSEKVRLISAREGNLARSADAVVTLSETMVEELVGRGVARSAITVVPNGVDPQLLEQTLSPAAARMASGLEVPEDALVAGAVSALVDYEGFDVLLRAAAELIHGGSALGERLHVLLAGDGEAAPVLRDLAGDLGIADRVHMPGRVPRLEASTWVQSLDVAVVPRLDREVSRSVTPQKPIEALALGRPVIVSDLPALRETVSGADGVVHGTLFPAGDADALKVALAAVLGSRRPGPDQGRELARSRTWPVLVRRYCSVYGHVTGS